MRKEDIRHRGAEDSDRETRDKRRRKTDREEDDSDIFIVIETLERRRGRQRTRSELTQTLRRWKTMTVMRMTQTWKPPAPDEDF